MEIGLIFGNTPSSESIDGFLLVSTNLPPKMNSGPQRYHYPVCYTRAATQHPLSRFQSSARGPALSLPRSLRSLHVVQRALSSKNIMRFFRTVSFLEKGFRTPFYSVFPSSMLKSKSPFARRKNPLMKHPALKGRTHLLNQPSICRHHPSRSLQDLHPILKCGHGVSKEQTVFCDQLLQ